ncbi:hypothetical protein D5R81_13050 [Parashewanella spongiae]|uniref:Uncharacterized protein n=1 Tax=Parashewanella spongiae TaxID=342950 RepID=A0A3A6TTX0_9GAMM|nr:hypothetical protein [Parashewanella spongiae]MCL1079346.1 hypothetical protein [Parashewanella spongiae]RJY11478.1 hypothetical protein D5R81_13050 [Parashewanella spongiae]
MSIQNLPLHHSFSIDLIEYSDWASLEACNSSSKEILEMSLLEFESFQRKTIQAWKRFSVPVYAINRLVETIINASNGESILDRIEAIEKLKICMLSKYREKITAYIASCQEGEIAHTSKIEIRFMIGDYYVLVEDCVSEYTLEQLSSLCIKLSIAEEARVGASQLERGVQEAIRNSLQKN